MTLACSVQLPATSPGHENRKLSQSSNDYIVRQLKISSCVFYSGTSAQSCKEGSVEHDHLGQRRTCRGGKWSAPCRVRREWNGMLPGERWVNVTVHLQCEKTPLFPWHLCYLLTCKWSPLPSHITSGIFSLVNIHEKKNLNIIATGRRHWSMM